MKKLLIISVAILTVMPLLGQIDMPKPAFSPYGNPGKGLLNMKNLDMSHSMGFSAGASSNGSGYYMSRYTNHLKYSFSPKLKMDLDLNFVNFGTASNSFKINDDNSSRVLPELTLDYQPYESVKIQVKYRMGYPMLGDIRPWYERW